MGVISKKPYEISIWEDRLVTVPVSNVDGAGANDESEDTSISYYKEVKLAVIGSDKMTHPSRAFDPVLTENVNGEKTLTFSIAYRYFDPIVQDVVSNPFLGYLINERKVKLFYNNEWSEFLIKECDEQSEDYIFKYTARELFTIELSKTGYNITLDQSLNNNQGTVLELGEKALEGTDWQVDKENSDLLKQYVQDPLYICEPKKEEGQEEASFEINVLNLDTNESEPLTISTQVPIYVFYSYISNKTTANVQFIYTGDREKFTITDNHVIKSTNYRFNSEITYSEDGESFTIDGNEFVIGSINYSNQGYRLVYGPLTTYDPVMERTVDIYEAEYDDGVREIYHYSDYTYSTSDVVVSYMANGSNFNVYEEGTLQGWSNKTPVSETSGKSVLQPIALTTRPEVSETAPLKAIDSLNVVEGYLKLKFAGTLTEDYKNTYFNEGFNYNASLIDHISQGETFALRLRLLTGDTENQVDLNKYVPTETNGGVRAIVATYTTNDQYSYLNDKDLDKEGKTPSKVKSYQINPEGIVLNFNGQFEESVNLISNGTFDTESRYIVDSVIQTPSTLYVYKDKVSGEERVWSPVDKKYVPKGDAAFFSDYYITTAPALRSYSNEELSDPTFHLGVFIYTKDDTLAGKWVFIQDIQLTRYYEAANGEPVTIGNVPTAVSTPTDYFYLKPTDGMLKNQVTTYGELDFLASELGLNKEKITQVYNKDSEKILSIQESQSNCFNILQDLCETFECWLKINVAHDEDGSITLDENFNPIKKVAFKEYCGKENFSGFKNGINLTGIERQIDSNEIVTKLIVDPVQSEYSDSGSIDIQDAKSNPSGESTIINLSYYLNKGLITDVAGCNKDLNKFNEQLKEKNNSIQELRLEQAQAKNALIKSVSKRNTYTALIDEANKSYNEALEKFSKITGIDYNEYVNQVEAGQVSEDTEKKVRSESALEAVSEIYVALSTITNYSGLLTNLNEEYTQLDLLCNGAQTYSVSVSYIPGLVEDEEVINPSVKVTFSDYVSGFRVKLIDENGGYVFYQTSPNDKVFTASDVERYTDIQFVDIPDGYKLKYFVNNESYELDHDDAELRIFAINKTEPDVAYNIHFEFIPNEDYAEQHVGFQDRINKIIEEKKEIEKEFYKKYSRFLEEGTWSSQDYINPELYYLDALQVSNTSAEPKVTYTINVLEVSQLQNLENYDFRVGDKTYIEDVEFFGYLVQAIEISSGTQAENGDFGSLTQENTANYSTYYDWEHEADRQPQIGIVKTPVQEEVIVSEIEWHLDEPDNNTITIQNYKTRFEDLFQRISATVQTVQRNENTYPKTTAILGNDGLINSSLLADSLSGLGSQGFLLTSNGSVATTNDGLVVRDLANSANLLRLMSRGVEVSQDGGQSWSTAISADGISTNLLTAGTINTQNIWLMDGDNPTFRWDKAGLSAYGLDENGNFNYNLKTYVRFDKYGLYGIKDGEDYVASSLDDIKNKAHFGVTWDGFFIKNSYTDGRVEITSDDDFRVLTTDAEGRDHERIKIGAVEKDSSGAPTKYGINIMNDNGDVVFDTGDDGNVTVSGTINALAGNFSGQVNVGNPDSTHIIIDGTEEEPTISSSNYSDGAGTGWIINSNGDATFSNVSVRGAIKTAVFEYEEIQAVGGAFLFRPSSTIKTARAGDAEAGESANDLYVSVEKPLMFKVGSWVKISNYNSMDTDPAADLTTYGLVHIYKIKEITTLDFNSDEEYDEPEDDTNADAVVGTEVDSVFEEPSEDDGEFEPAIQEIVLEDGAAILESVPIEGIPGGALIDFGVAEGTYVPVTPKETDNPQAKGWYELDGADYVLTEDTTVDSEKTYYKEAYENGRYNYGIGINSSDNYVNLPARAISLFETTIHPNDTSKVTYNYRGILGTLPVMQSGVDTSIYRHMQGTQGIYTDNMYLGDEGQFIAFYEDENHQKQLRIKANQIVFEVTDDEGQGTGVYHDINQIEAEGVPGPAGEDGEDAISTIIDSSAGNVFVNGVISTILRCYVYKGGMDITNDNNYIKSYTWTKININDGSIIQDWTPTAVPLEPNAIRITADDVTHKAVFQCSVDVEEV